MPTGYQSLGFAFHPGDAVLPEEGWLKVRVNETQLDLLEERSLADGAQAFQDLDRGQTPAAKIVLRP